MVAQEILKPFSSLLRLFLRDYKDVVRIHQARANQPVHRMPEVVHVERNRHNKQSAVLSGSRVGATAHLNPEEAVLGASTDRPLLLRGKLVL